jgi:triosephosphate isomerase
VIAPTPTIVAISLKMYFSNARTREYCRRIAELAQDDHGVRTGATELVVLPTFVSVPAALAAVRETRVTVGAQDLATHDSGAFTGEVSGAELAEIGCTHVEVGHVERRTLFAETDPVVAAKLSAALRNRLVPILCVGEASRTDPAAAADVCIRQVLSALPQDVGDTATSRIIVAYEPIWAVGAAEPAGPNYVADVCQRVRIALNGYLPDFAIIYGGSAGPGLLTKLGGNVDGLFLGRFAHDPRAVLGVLAEAAAHQRPATRN